MRGFYGWTQQLFRSRVTTLEGNYTQRILSREEGRALELIGHGVDYLVDSYVYEGADDEFIDVGAFSNDAIQILVSMRHQILLSTHVSASERRSIRTTFTRGDVEACAGNPMEQCWPPPL